MKTDRELKTDRQLKFDVMEELAWEPAVNDMEIGVEVADGIVTLTGNLGSFAEKYAAERAVQKVAGVRGVAVDMNVRLAGPNIRTDSDIAHTASLALDWNSWLLAGAVKVMVENGWVTLTGQVDHEFQRTVAENALRALMGVVGVSNQITVKPAVLSTDVKSQIEFALKRQAHVDAQNIVVEVHGDHVILSGKVVSLAESLAAVKAAAAAPGVTRVVNKMLVA
jgi:osmotically-inducible protein OsmY